MAQRLVRKVCKNCGADYKPTNEELMDAGISEEEAANINFKKGKGCVHCDNTGYSGREGIFEMLEISVDIRRLIFNGEDQDKIREVALQNGMQTLHDSALLKMKQGLTTIKEVIKLTISD